MRRRMAGQRSFRRAASARRGTKNRPAPIGTPLSAGHQHARALRAMGNEILRDLWREARRLHGVGDDFAEAS